MNVLTSPTAEPVRASRGRRLAIAALWTFGLLGLAGLAGVLALLHGLDASPLQVTINDESVTGSFDLDQWSLSHQALLFGGLAVALFAVLVIVPVALLVALLGVVLAYVAVIGSIMVSYARARAEGVGLHAEVGWFQRPERIVLLGVLPAAFVLTDGLPGLGPAIHLPPALHDALDMRRRAGPPHRQ